MTDEEIICGWMETGPIGELVPVSLKPKDRWWGWEGKPIPVALTLDRLHEVEARLTSAQQDQYSKVLSRLIYAPDGPSAFYRTELFDFFHATATQKIKALATVLRGGVAS